VEKKKGKSSNVSCGGSKKRVKKWNVAASQEKGKEKKERNPSKSLPLGRKEESTTITGQRERRVGRGVYSHPAVAIKKKAGKEKAFSFP